MLLDRVHDVLLGLIAMASLIMLYGLLRPRRARVPDCPRCGYTHKMPRAEVCPECGHRPRSPAVWLGRRARYSKRVRRMLLATFALAIPATIAIGVLHGRWASVMPTGVLIESLRVMPLGTDVGRDRAIRAVHRRDFTRGQAEQVLRAVFDSFGNWHVSRAALGNPAVEEAENQWRSRLMGLAIGIRIGDDDTIFSAGRPRLPRPGGPSLVPMEGRPFLAEAAASLDPDVHRVLLDALSEGSDYRGMLATVTVGLMGKQARAMVPELLKTLGADAGRRLRRNDRLAAVLFTNPEAVRSFLREAPLPERQILIDLAPREVYIMDRETVAFLRQLIDSPGAADLNTRELREALDLWHPPRRAEREGAQEPATASPP